MKVYLITEKEMEELREKLRTNWLEHCSTHGLSPTLVNNPKDSSYSLWAAFNFTYCCWMSSVGNERNYKDLRVDES